MLAEYAALPDFLLLALALVLVWLVYVVVRLWRAVRNQFIEQHYRRRSHSSPAAAPTEQHSEEPRQTGHRKLGC